MTQDQRIGADATAPALTTSSAATAPVDRTPGTADEPADTDGPEPPDPTGHAADGTVTLAEPTPPAAREIPPVRPTEPAEPIERTEPAEPIPPRHRPTRPTGPTKPAPPPPPARAARRSDAQRYVAALRAFEEVSRAPGQVSLLMEICVDRACEMVGATGGLIALLQEGELFYAATAGDLRGRLAGSQPVSHTFGGLAVTTGQTVHTRDARTDPRIAKEIAMPLGIRAAIATPLLQGRRKLGILWVSSPQPEAFDEVDVELVSRLGRVAGARFDHAQVREERRSSEQALVDNRLQQASLLAALDEGVIALDASRRVMLVNAAAERILGVSRERLLASDALGMPWNAIHADGTRLQAADQPAAQTLRTRKPLTRELLGVHRPDGTLRWLSVTTVPVFDASGDTLRGVVVCFSDVTAARATRERDHTRIARLLDQTERLCRAGTWEWCADSGQVYWSAGLRELVGQPASDDSPASLRAYLALVHPDDRPALRQAMADVRDGNTSHLLDHRIVTCGGVERRLRCVVELRRDRDGHITRAWGSLVDLAPAEPADLDLPTDD